MTRPWKILIYILYVIFVAELFARSISYFTGHGFSTDNKRFISPFFTGTDIPYPILTDSSGIFNGNHEVSFLKDIGEFRIVFIGGSTTQNNANVKKLRYSSKINEKLKNEFPNQKITVINAGVSGFSSAHSLINLSLRIVEFEPDIIVVHHNINDRSANYVGSYTSPDYANKYLSDFYLGYDHRNGIKGFLVRNFKAVRILIWSSRLFKSILVDADYNERGKEDTILGKKYFKRNLESMLSICKQHNIIPVLLNQPARNLFENPIHLEYNDIIHKVAKNNNVDFIDIASSISLNKNNFIDEVHYTVSGIDAIAETINPYLLEILKEKILSTD